MEHEKLPLFIFHIFGIEIPINTSIIIQWAIILVLAVLSIILTRNLKRIPDKKQSALEWFYEVVEGLVKENMGEENIGFVPFIGTLILYLLCMNVIPVLGIPAPTEELSVTLGMGAAIFFVVQGYAIYKVGLGHYFKGYLNPIPVILPMNIIERLILPVSLGLRLFGNIAAGAVIMGIAYEGLGGINPLLSIGLPVPFHFYFDLFDGFIQMLIFIMLTMINIKLAVEH
ncbi:F0F1 ATP synthase subunit A [Clostridium thermarum]|uniref:F0F1 ATP synthase subunit A n=1 Tax=Clostridium thermarum TaxID=1716543 RepID=UPI0011240AE7|nr:F0F1 ATP synthase subunit A [Clostridium thermarum]